MGFERCKATGLWAALLLLLLMVNPAVGQEINLDRMEQCGDLVCYQSLKEIDVFYYLPDQPRLATKNGRPQFSFLKYARTEKTGQAGTGRAEGGGIVHFLVTYGADKGRVKAAEKALQEKHPDARIAGPIVYRKGSFALITSFKEDNEVTTRTVAVGKAPLMEGQKAAVSMALTREGAELLWESFKSDTPDISLVFDMEFAGVREPYEATLEADWSRISKHHRVKAGFKYKWFGADVDILLQELRQTGAVKITTKGESAPLDKILDSVNAKLLQVMFDPAPTDDLSRAAAEKNSYSSLNQAVQLLRNAAGSSRSSSRSQSTSFLPRNWEEICAAWQRMVVAAAYADDAPGGEQAPNEQRAETPDSSPPASDSDQQLETPGSEGTDSEDESLRQIREVLRVAREATDRGDYPQALEHFREALRLIQERRPTNRNLGNAHWNIAQCHEFMDQRVEAIHHYRRAVDFYGPGSADGRAAREAAERLDREGAPSERVAGEGTGSDAAVDEQAPAESASDSYNRARRLYDEARSGGFQTSATRQALEAYQAYQIDHNPTGERGREVSGRIRMLQQRLAQRGEALADRNATSGNNAGSSMPLPDPFAGEETASSSNATANRSAAASSSTSRSSSGSTAGRTSTASSGPSGRRTPAASSTRSSSTARPSSSARSGTGSAAQRRSNNQPGFSLVASYQMKNIKRSGKLTYNMNHYRTENQAFAMAENIGSLYSRYGHDPRVFRAVTIDDPVFKQREILVTLDGQDAATFTRHLNYVTVKLKKQHQSGAVTSDEVVITPAKFNAEGNAFSLGYGYKGDDDRSAWLDYRYQTLWSFHGGVEIRSPWDNADSPMLALQPPHRYRSVTFEGEGEALAAAGVRHGVITVTSLINGRTVTQQATVRNKGPMPAVILDIAEDLQQPQVEVQIDWYLNGGRKISGPVMQLSGELVYWDEIPGGGA